MSLLIAAATLWATPSVPGGELTVGQIVALADDLSGPRGAVPGRERLTELERRAAAAFLPGGPPGRTGAPAELALLNALTAERRLARVMPAAVLDRLRADRERCHAADPVVAGDGPHPKLAALRAKFPKLSRDLAACPGLTATVLAALSLPDRPARLAAVEPILADAETGNDGGVAEVRLARSLETPAERPGAVPALLVEVFNAHILGPSGLLWERAGEGRISRDEYVWSVVALEQLSVANAQRAMLENAAELRAAGVSLGPYWWWVGGTEVFLPRPTPDAAALREYPHSVYGRAYDRMRWFTAVRDGEFWEAAVTLDRLALAAPDGHDRDPLLLGSLQMLKQAGEGSAAPWVHRRLPERVRSWLALCPIGARLPAAAGQIGPAWRRLVFDGP